MMPTILVPLDGSPFGEQALVPAAAIARRTGARLRLVHVHPQVALLPFAGSAPIDPDWERRARESERAYLDAVAGRVGTWTEGAVETALLEGPAAEMLDRDARESGAELIVMTTHGRGGLRRAWLGSVADGLVRRTVQPVLLIRPSDGGPAIDPDTLFRRILIPLDGSELAEQVVPRTVKLGKLSGAEFLLVRVVVPGVLIDDGSAGPGLQVDREYTDHERAAAERYLDEVAARLRARAIAVRTIVVEHAQPAVAILEQADAQAVDLVAMATHGRGGVARLLLGSVADKVLRATTRPLLLLRPG